MITVANGDLVKSFDLPKTTMLEFSPLNKILVTWKQYTSEYNGKASNGNMAVQCDMCDLLIITHLLILLMKKNHQTL